ncbi:hypothetical protein Nepgr_017494 [Nepenthes gracilis]|uniref:Uncharacterized protein n=1 Tax=Nepenthes gracilis TaxID=150966 RepID=A0AAD3SQH3_NEPGR|nr:hypothetical protein Nepgr_017494 [Nepenthes gracilis]
MCTVSGLLIWRNFWNGSIDRYEDLARYGANPDFLIMVQLTNLRILPGLLFVRFPTSMMQNVRLGDLFGMVSSPGMNQGGGIPVD